MSSIILNEAKAVCEETSWEIGGDFHSEYPPRYHLHMLILKEDDGTFSAVVLNLPGVGSCGGTVEQAISNAKDAVRETLAVYREGGEEIPWKDSAFEELPPGGVAKWVVLQDA